jgi:hypothetical protein
LVRRLAALSTQYHPVRRPVPLVWSSEWSISDDERELLWSPYVARVSEAIEDLSRADPSYRFDAAPVGVGAVAYDAVRGALPAPARRLVKRAAGAAHRLAL